MQQTLQRLVSIAAIPITAASAVCFSIAAPTDGYAQNCASYRTKIVGGEKASIAAWPGQAALRRHADDDNVSVYFCGGTAISDRWVLTAAHCVPDFVTSVTGPFVDGHGVPRNGRLEVVLGVQDLIQTPPERAYKVERVIVHEVYRAEIEKALGIADEDDRKTALENIPAVAGHDIALLRLDRAYSGAQATLSLRPSSDPHDTSRAQVRVAGYGTTEHVTYLKLFDKADGRGTLFAASPQLLETAVEAIPTAQCRAVEQYAQAHIGPAQICAGLDQGGQDSCRGDSGGPLVISDQRGCPRQIGVVSWGAGCAEKNAYGIYTRVSHFADWIQSHTGPLNNAANQPTPHSGNVLTVAQVQEGLQQLEEMLGRTKGRLKLGIAGGNRVKLGDKVVFEAESDIAGKLLILDINAEREIMPIYPNKFVGESEIGLIRAKQRVAVPGPDYPGFTAFQAVEPTGKGTLLALVVPEDFEIERVAAKKSVMAKGFAPVNEPPSYLMRIIRQIETALSLRTRSGSPAGDELKTWAYSAVDYEIVR